MIKHLLALLVFFGTFLYSTAQTAYSDYFDGRLYVKMQPASIKSAFKGDPFNLPKNLVPFEEELYLHYGITKISRPFHQADDDEVLPFVLKIEFSQFSRVDDFIRDLQKIKGVEYAEKVPIMKTHATPNDPLYSSLGHLTQINAPNAWNVFNGNSNIRVAVIDVATMWTHADLVANTYTNTGEIPNNGVDDDGNGYKDDVNGYDVTDNDNNAEPTQTGMFHGTHCAGIVGARTDNSVGIAAIGWNVKIIPVKCQTDNGLPGWVNNGFEGIVYAVKAKAHVISCSWGGSGPSNIEQAVINFAWNRGCIVIASAGNNSTNTPTYPGAYNNVYCVASVNSSDVGSSFSNFGTWVDICAPGNSILSTMPYAPTATAAYFPLSGTSMAAPMVAGLAALMLSKSPNMTRQNVLNCISSTAVNIYSLSGNSAYAMGNQLGAGRIDAYAAMLCAANFSATAPVANFYALPRHTCPGTSVKFYDSSLYAPTSWNWTFQGGTPATSTASNPTVQWGTPGTYSVLLTVSNASGSNAITKLSYVTISGPLPLPFAEGFQATQFLPANWSGNNIYNDPMYWERKTGVGGFGTSTACAMFDNFNYFAANERDEMWTARYNLSAVSFARLRFDVAYAKYDNVFSDSLEVKISTNCGSTWTSIYLNGGSTFTTAPDASGMFVPNSGQWRTDSINISSLAAGQGNVMFSFINRGHYGQSIYLDNINLFTSTLGVNIVPAATICAGAPITFSNSAPGTSSYIWTFSGANLSTSSSSSPVVNYASAGVYTVSLIRYNNTTTVSTVSNVTVIAGPAVSVNSPTTCPGNTVQLTASGATSYSWNSASGSSTISVSPVSTTVYTLSGSNGGCATTQFATVFVVPPPVPALTMSPAGCDASCVGEVNATISGGTGPFNYSLSGNACTSVPCGNLCPGSYTLSTADVNGCLTNTSFTIANASNNIASAITSTPASCSTCSDGVLDAGLSGGYAPYTYTWSPVGGNGAIATGLSTGCYTISASDAKNCAFTATTCVGDITGLGEQMPGQNKLEFWPNPADNVLDVFAGGEKFELRIYNSLGQQVYADLTQVEFVSVNVTHLSKGIYLIEAKTNKLIYRGKVIVN